MAGGRVKGGAGHLESLQSVSQTDTKSEPSDPNRTWQREPGDCHFLPLPLPLPHWGNSLFRDWLCRWQFNLESTSQSKHASMLLWSCINGHARILFSLCPCPFICFRIGRWPLYCIISPATTLQFAISFCFCVIVANIDFGEGDRPVSLVQHQKAND